MILFLKKKPPKLLEKLRRSPATIEGLRKVLAQEMRSPSTVDYVASIYSLVARKHPSELEKCVEEYRGCGAAALLACTFHVVGTHKEEYEKDLEALGSMYSVEAAALGPRKAVSEARAREKDFKKLRSVLEWFGKVCSGGGA